MKLVIIEYVNQEYNTNFVLKIQHKIRLFSFLKKNGFFCTENQLINSIMIDS